jgi:hypothetical protein
MYGLYSTNNIATQRKDTTNMSLASVVTDQSEYYEAGDLGGCPMAKSVIVNLDALIPREDFLATDQGADAGGTGKSEISRTDLLKAELFQSTLRKPDFQRETAAWSPEAICRFLETFVDDELIPSVICWQSPSRLTFVIDGAHRLSAVMAWLYDDYGDGEESVRFYANNIPEEQKKIADTTRAMVNASIGSYKEYMAATQHPKTNPKLESRVRSLAHSKIPLLWVKGSDSQKAERAFLTINQSAVPIDPTEFTILNSRSLPNAIAARAIVRNAAGYKYWDKFSPEGIVEIEKIAKSIYSALYKPPLETPLRSLELPIAGMGYGTQTLPLVFDMVNIANKFTIVDPSKKSKQSRLAISHDKPNEDATRSAIGKTKRLVDRFTGTDPSSLGLHPAVYFYASNGRHQPTSVLALALLLSELDDQTLFIKFTSVRKQYEDFLMNHKMFVNQLTVKHGSMVKGFRPLKDYYLFVLERFFAGKNEIQIEGELKGHDKYQTLVKERPVLSKKAKKLSQGTKDVHFLENALKDVSECQLCSARIDYKSIHFDHIQERSKGGLGTSANTQMVHPFCDSAYKPYLQNRQ